MTLDRTMVVAEAGVNHNGNLTLATRLIDAAAAAGADAVKFQTFRADRIATRTSAKAAYQLDTTDAGETQHEMLRRLELDPAQHETLVAHCVQRGIAFLSTAFDVESVDLLAGLGQRIFKIPSGEITNLPLLRHVGRLGAEVILSTGMSTLDDVGAALDALRSSGTPRERVTVLHCTSDYPAAFDEVNLRAMTTMASAFGVRVGYSDHTTGSEVAVAAVALGATIVEKHFTLDRSLPGPDHRASLEPAELQTFVAAIRNIERAMGDGVKRPTSAEVKTRLVVRKSLVASRAIRAGEVFSSDNLAAKRPGIGLSPMRWDEVIGRPASRDYSPDELIIL